MQEKLFPNVISFKLHKNSIASFNYIWPDVCCIKPCNFIEWFISNRWLFTLSGSWPDSSQRIWNVKTIENCDLVSDSTLTVTLLNTRSFRKHAIDIVYTVTFVLLRHKLKLIRILAGFQNYCITDLRFAIMQRETNFVVLPVVVGGAHWMPNIKIFLVLWWNIYATSCKYVIVISQKFNIT